MASIKTKPIINDSGSQLVAELIQNNNDLLDVLGTLITGLKTAANIGAVNTLATTAEASLEAITLKFTPQPNLTLAPSFKAM